ncbi:MAG: hypothetical protein KBH07_02755 [Flavobacteriales bacterium]|nr:hypothetical protein [Flavobacteriales bacterium]MBP9079266.1 hypothetical protein [Flavobacteriales bacterium]
MKASTIGSVLLIALFAAACGAAEAPHDHDHGHDHDHDHDTMQAGDHDHAEETAGHAVQLDHGQTWSANPETTEGIAAMKALVDGYNTASGNSALLKDSLVVEFKDIFAKCTMTGEAHDQLHNYLIPLKGMLDSLGTTPDAAKLGAMGNYLGTYHQYFH